MFDIPIFGVISHRFLFSSPCSSPIFSLRPYNQPHKWLTITKLVVWSLWNLSLTEKRIALNHPKSACKSQFSLIPSFQSLASWFVGESPKSGNVQQGFGWTCSQWRLSGFGLSTCPSWRYGNGSSLIWMELRAHPWAATIWEVFSLCIWFPEMGMPPVIIHFDRIFPDQASSYWGYPFMETSIWLHASRYLAMMRSRNSWICWVVMCFCHQFGSSCHET